jgi:hypothetical protein
LDAVVRTSCRSVAPAKLDVNAVNAVGVDHGETVDGIARDWARITVVTKMHLDTEGLKPDVVEMATVPTLHNSSE